MKNYGLRLEMIKDKTHQRVKFRKQFAFGVVENYERRLKKYDTVVLAFSRTLVCNPHSACKEDISLHNKAKSTCMPFK